MKALILSIVLVASVFAQCAAPSYNVLVTAHGDSITYGSGAGVTTPYLARLSTLMTSAIVTVTTVNGGTPGISWSYAWSGWPSNPNTMIQEAAAVIDPSLASAGYKTKWLILFAGTNGVNATLGNHSAAVEYANFSQYIAARRTAGWDMSRTIVCTMLPRGAAEESKRTTYNALLVTGAAEYKYKLARFDSDPTIGQAGQDTNTTYYVDGVHPTDAGHVILADIIYAAMFGDAGSPQVSCGQVALTGVSLAGVTVK